jgi:hypothetical protein
MSQQSKCKENDGPEAPKNANFFEERPKYNKKTHSESLKVKNKVIVS